MRISLRHKLLAGAAAFALIAGLGAAYSASTLNSSLSACISGQYAGANAIASQVANLPTSACYGLSMATGTGANQADLVYVGRRTLAPSANETLDLTGSGASLTDPFGATLNFLHVKAIYIRAASGNTNDVVVGAAAAPFVGPMGGTTPTTAAKPNGAIFWANPGAGWAVVDSSSDGLKVANGAAGTSITYDIIIVGTST